MAAQFHRLIVIISYCDQYSNLFIIIKVFAIQVLRIGPFIFIKRGPVYSFNYNIKYCSIVINFTKKPLMVEFSPGFVGL